MKENVLFPETTEDETEIKCLDKTKPTIFNKASEADERHMFSTFY